MYNNNYISKFSTDKNSKVFLPTPALPSTHITSKEVEEIRNLSEWLYGYLDQFISVSKITLSQLFTDEVSSPVRLKELIKIAIWIHKDIPIAFSMGDSRELALDIFQMYVVPGASIVDATIIAYFLDALTLYGYYSIKEFNQSFVRTTIYNLVTSASISHPQFLDTYLRFISWPSHDKDVEEFQKIVLQSYAQRTNLLYTANSAFFGHIEPGLKLILDSENKQLEKVL